MRRGPVSPRRRPETGKSPWSRADRLAGAAVGFAAEGLRRQSVARLRLGLGLARAEPANLSFAALRVVGLVIVLVALAQLVRVALHDLSFDQWRQQEELAVAALHMERASELSAERDHELRNGLVHLARINEGPGLPPGREHAVLEPGVRDESAGGTGLGLHISRQLVAREVGTLTLRTAESPHGCVAAVTVPAAPASSFSTHPKDWIVDRAGCG